MDFRIGSDSEQKAELWTLAVHPPQSEQGSIHDIPYMHF
jgi:hypothetical protein